jgi:general secretion pathway protein F
MPRFRYTAYSAEGVREDGTLDAASESQAWEKLTALNLTVVELLKDFGTSQVRPQGLRLVRGIPIAAQADLAEQLAVLFQARLTAMQIVEVIEKGTSVPALRRKFQRIGQLMADGASFPNALSEVGSELSPLFVSLTRIGQETGDPSALMKSLATTLRRQQKMSSQISTALVYPAILILGGLGILALMSLYLAPRLATIFTSVEKEVPSAISLFIMIGSFLSNWWFVLVAMIFVCLVLLPVYARRHRYSVNLMVQKLPLFGPIARDASLARLSRSVQIMLAAGVPLAPTLRATATALPLEPLSRHFEAAAGSIEAGGTGREVFAEARDLPRLFQELFAIGERTNTLPTVTEAVATALEDQVERRVQRAMLLLTPVLTLVIGGGIAILVYAVMSALLSVNDMAF